MTVLGNRPEDVLTDSKGNVLKGVTLTFYGSQADALATVNPIGSSTTNGSGRWNFDAGTSVPVWARDPSGSVWEVAVGDAVTAAALDAANAAAASAAASAALVGAPAGTVMDAYLGGSASNLLAYFKRAAGAGTYTNGDVLKLGAFAYITRTDVGTSIVMGGGNAGQENVVGGNLANVDTATSNLTGAATLTNENGNWNFLLGGYDTVVNGWANSVVGFHCKVGLDANHNTIGGGSRHSVAASSAYGTVGGGTLNQVSGNQATVSGGNANQATNNSAAVGGGTTNIASGNAATIAGGTTNTANNASATIGGGSTNVASGNSATIGGGLTNTASATGATIPGGRDNIASGTYSLATGRGASAIEPGQHAHANEIFAAQGDAQLNRWCLKKQTTDATASNLDTSPGAPPVIPNDTTWAFNALIVARRTDVDGENASWEVKGCFKRDAGNTAALVGTPTVTSLGANAGNTWTVSVGSFSVGTLRFIVTGEAAKTIRWVAELRAASVSG